MNDEESWKVDENLATKLASYKTRHIVIPGLGSHMAARVLGKEDATFARLAHTEEALPGSEPCRLTGRIGVKMLCI